MQGYRRRLAVTLIVLVFGFALALGGGCRKAPESGPGEPEGAAPAPAAAAAAALADEALEVDGVGRRNPKNAAELLPLADEVAQCEYKQRIDHRTCEAFKAFGEQATSLAPPAGFETLLHLLEDESPGLRFAAANALRLRNFNGRPFEQGEFLQTALARIAAEEDPHVLSELGGLVGKFRLSHSGHTDAVLAVLKSHPRKEARTGMLLHVLFSNRDVPGVFEAVAEVARTDEDEEIKRAAIGAYWTAGSARRDEIIALWREALAWPQGRAAAHAAYMLAHWNRGVAEAYDDVLAATRKRAEDKTLTWDFLSGLYWYVHNNQPFADRAQIFDMLSEIATDSGHPWNVRSRAMTIMKETGDERLASVIEPLREDPEMLVAKHAERVLEEAAAAREKAAE